MEELSEEVEIVDPEDEHDDDRDDQNVEASGLQQLGFAAANLMDQLDAASSSSSTGVRTPGSSSSSSSSMNAFSGSSLGINSADTPHHPFDAGLEVTFSVFKKKQAEELRQKLAEIAALQKEKERRRLMQIQTQNELEQRVKVAQSQQALVGGAAITQSKFWW